MEKENQKQEVEVQDEKNETPCVLEEINIEELAVDGICGIY